MSLSIAVALGKSIFSICPGLPMLQPRSERESVEVCSCHLGEVRFTDRIPAPGIKPPRLDAAGRQ